MSNDYFQFKQFRIDQDGAAMKVTTEACILGAYIPADAHRILDIGAGTGILSLMIAQRADGKIHAVEIHKASANLARQNALHSPFHERIRIHHCEIRDFAPGNLRYDLIVSNPPFFGSSLRPNDRGRNSALHEETLNQNSLLESVKELLGPDGIFVVIYPEREAIQFRNMAIMNGLQLQASLTILNRPGQDPFRLIQTFGYRKILPIEKQLAIRDSDGNYSSAFRELLTPYYLAF